MSVRNRIEQQFPTLFITLLSVLIGLVFADLVGQARARMTLWPLDLATLRTWSQILAIGFCAFSVWVVFAHIGISRLRLPTLADSMIVFVLPVPLMIGSSLVGRAEIWPWFYYASGYLIICTASTLWQIFMAAGERDLASFARLARPGGLASIFYVGIPSFAIAGWADQRAMLSPLLETLIAFSPTPAALICTALFFRDWHKAIAAADMASP